MSRLPFSRLSWLSGLPFQRKSTASAGPRVRMCARAHGAEGGVRFTTVLCMHEERVDRTWQPKSAVQHQAPGIYALWGWEGQGRDDLTTIARVKFAHGPHNRPPRLSAISARRGRSTQ